VPTKTEQTTAAKTKQANRQRDLEKERQKLRIERDRTLTVISNEQAAAIRDAHEQAGRQRRQVWDTFKHAPAPVGYDPAIVPGWGSPTSDNFAALRLEPWRLRVFPGGVLLGTADPSTILTWAR